MRRDPRAYDRNGLQSVSSDAGSIQTAGMHVTSETRQTGGDLNTAAVNRAVVNRAAVNRAVVNRAVVNRAVVNRAVVNRAAVKGILKKTPASLNSLKLGGSLLH